MAQSGPKSGGDLFDLAKDGTTVPEDSAKPRLISSKPRPDQIASEADPNYIGGTTLAEAADNAGDIPRVCTTSCLRVLSRLSLTAAQTVTDKVVSEVLTGTGDTMPSQTDSKRLHNVPGGVVHDPNAKGSTRYEKHIVGDSDVNHGASEGPGVDKAPGDEEISDEAAMDKLEKKI